MSTNQKVECLTTDRPRTTQSQQCRPYSSQSSSHGNMKDEKCMSSRGSDRNMPLQKQMVDPYVETLTKNTRGRIKPRFSSTDYLMQW
ncbi:hypothetical protein AC249_AIPGENE14334 [Exaiptasia diaphana]|nr:hypothetical protein AC249_AIPGENE14334 [Exaiptasia diaphana]